MDIDRLVEAVTQALIERLGCPGAKVVSFGAVPSGLIGPGVQVKDGLRPADVEGADYIVMTAQAFREFHGGVVPAGLSLAANAGAVVVGAKPGGAGIDLTAKRLVSERDLKDNSVGRGTVVKVGPRTIVTALARDFANGVGATIERA
jgi:hypothetical protein